jgi:hypothetical protein
VDSNLTTNPPISQKCSALLKFILAGLVLQAFGSPPLRPGQGNSDEKRGDVAQLVEQRTENPCVGGSIPSITTKSLPQTLDLQALTFRICVGATESAQHDFPRTPLQPRSLPPLEVLSWCYLRPGFWAVRCMFFGVEGGVREEVGGLVKTFYIIFVMRKMIFSSEK